MRSLRSSSSPSSRTIRSTTIASTRKLVLHYRREVRAIADLDQLVEKNSLLPRNR